MEQSWPSPPVTPAPLVLRGRVFDAGHPAVMGIINRTPDSFYAPARHSVESGLATLSQMVADGAALIEV